MWVPPPLKLVLGRLTPVVVRVLVAALGALQHASVRPGLYSIAATGRPHVSSAPPPTAPELSVAYPSGT